MSAAVEIVRDDWRRGGVRHALFDFDGTLSLIRRGWQDVMVPLMVETLLATPRHEPPDELERAVRAYVDRTTGVQTIYQMVGLQEMVRERGGHAEEPLAYKARYLERLGRRIGERIARLRSREVDPRELTVPGAREILSALRERDVTCYLASGTDVEYVRDEAELLGLASYFRGGIYGALADWQSYSKAMVIERILRDHGLRGHELVTFGDGYVEIEETVRAGGIAVGVATDEERLGGRVDAWKRERLVRAGAHVIVADLSPWPPLVALLCGDG